MTAKTRIVVVGATSAIAEHCCRLWVERSAVDLILVARDPAKAERIAADLRVRGARSTITVMTADFLDTADIDRIANAATASAPVDIVLIAQGVLPQQALCEDLAVCRDCLEVNAVSPALFAEAFARHFAQAGRGTIAIIGSVAGDRGRRSNFIYGAAKGGLDIFVQGLAHACAGTPARFVMVKPGFVDTPMTAAFAKGGLLWSSPERVAADMERAVRRGARVVYSPWFWWPIMAVVRRLPWFVFRRLKI